MPITDYHFENSIFFAKESGQIDKTDAEAWAAALRQHAASNPIPIVALVDALEVTFVSAAARMVFAEASKTENLQAVSVATKHLLVTQTARVIGMLGERGRTYVFENLHEARQFAEDMVRQLEKAYS